MHVCWNRDTQEVCGHPCEDYLAGFGCCCNGHQPAPYEAEEPPDDEHDGWDEADEEAVVAMQMEPWMIEWFVFWQGVFGLPLGPWVALPVRSQPRFIPGDNDDHWPPPGY